MKEKKYKYNITEELMLTEIAINVDGYLSTLPGQSGSEAVLEEHYWNKLIVASGYPHSRDESTDMFLDILALGYSTGTWDRLDGTVRRLPREEWRPKNLDFELLEMDPSSVN